MFAAAVAAVTVAQAWVAMAASAEDTAPGVALACPYDFGSDMDPGTFCVYRGAVRAPDGAVCAGDAVVIWHAQDSSDAGDSTLQGSQPSHVYFGFVDDPALVLHGVAVRPTRARLTDYRVGSGAVPLDGVTTLGVRTEGALTMALSPPLEFGTAEEPCDVDSYHGRFIGVVHRPHPQRAPTMRRREMPRCTVEQRFTARQQPRHDRGETATDLSAWQDSDTDRLAIRVITRD